MDVCEACLGPVRWVPTVRGRAAAFDPDGAPHTTTCPAGETQRRARTRAAARCTTCRGPLDPDLLTREHHTTHPTCDPHAAAALAAHHHRKAP